MKRKIIPIAIVSGTLGILWNWFFYGQMLGVSLVVFVMLVLGSTLALSAELGHRLSRSVLLLMLPLLFFAAMTAVLASGMLMFFNVVLTLYLTTLCLYLATHTVQLSDFRVRDYFHRLPELLPASLREARVEIVRALNFRQSTAASQNSLPIVRGILIALPIFLLFLALLSSADAVFRTFVGHLFNVHANPELIVRLLLIILITCLFIGAYALIFMRPQIPAVKTSASTDTPLRLGSTEPVIILSSVGALFLLFIVIQFTYFFGGNHRVMVSGMTYAEYARHGFFELIAVAVLSFFLLWWLQKTVRTNNPRRGGLFQYLAAGLIAEVMIIMLSAHLRLNLYEQAYGFTDLRLLSHLFIGWLAIIFVLLAIHILRQEGEQSFAFRAFLSVMAFFVVLNLLNPEGFVTRQNINRLHSTGKIDLVYVNSLSEDSVPAIASLLHDPNQALRQNVAGHLETRKYIQSHQNGYHGWQAWNLSRQKANDIFTANSSALAADKDYVPQDFN